MTLKQMGGLSPDASQGTSNFKLGMDTLKQPSSPDKTFNQGMGMSYTESNKKLVEAGRDQAIKAGNSVDGINTHSNGSLMQGADKTGGPMKHTTQSMDQN